MYSNMYKVPIVFAFDDKLIMPACVCITSLLIHAHQDTFYEITVIHPDDDHFNKEQLKRVVKNYSNCSLAFISIRSFFEGAYEVRGITKATYYRLLIPELLPQYDKVVYADVDIIFRMDLSELYGIDLGSAYLGGTYDIGMLLEKEGRKHMAHLGLGVEKYIQAGLLLINSKKMREDNLSQAFLRLSTNNYKYQDQDIINITCHESHIRLPLKYNMTDYTFMYMRKKHDYFNGFEMEEIKEALTAGNLHFNGHKPWVKYSLNFDVWWEYYRKSPIYDFDYYIDFFYGKVNLFDQLSLWKRIKILLRFFIYGRG